VRADPASDPAARGASPRTPWPTAGTSALIPEVSFEPLPAGPTPAGAVPSVAEGPTIPAEAVRRLAAQVRLLVGRPVRLLVHDNRSTMVSFRREDDCLHLRVHHMFVGAGDDVVGAIAEYARTRSNAAGRVLDRFVRSNRTRIKPLDVERARARPLRTAGRVYDLACIYDALNERYFGGELDARIGWGQGMARRRRRSIRMGAYYHDTRTILIHPALDRPDVPRYFVELVVYHEMLHQAVPQERTPAGRRIIHSPEFRARETRFHDFRRARTWERRNLPHLLKNRRALPPL